MTSKKLVYPISADVRDAIIRIINDAMEAKDRSVTVYFFENGPQVTIFPISINDEDE